jgi:cold shock CspA family protein
LSTALHRGVVTAFDEAAGFGTVTGGGAGECWFHCTGIADGSRSIAVGTEVLFSLVAGVTGRWEGWALRPTGDAGAVSGIVAPDG